MHNFYTIINIATNATADEKLSVGLIIVSNHKIWIRFSQSKMKIARILLKDDASVLEFIEKNIIRKIEDQNELIRINKSNSQLFNYNNIIQSEYFEYLNVYNNNILQFSKPIEIIEEVTDKIFNNLFNLLISKETDKKEIIRKYENNFNIKIKNNLIEKVESKVHTYQNFTSELLPSLYFNFEMECIGLNGVFTGAKAISFEKSPSYIDNQLSHYFVLSELLERKYKKNNEKNNFFLIVDEPSNRNSKEHDYWIKIQKQDKFQVISSDDSEEVVQKIESTGAHTFIE